MKDNSKVCTCTLTQYNKYVNQFWIHVCSGDNPVKSLRRRIGESGGCGTPKPLSCHYIIEQNNNNKAI